MTSSTPLRRQPVQRRSAKRVDQMLEASAVLIDELGYDGVTTTLIAERAGVAVGSLYQFFPDKRAVVQAMTQRNLEHFLTTIQERLAAAELEHWWDAAEVAFDVYVQMYRETPGFRRIRFGDAIDLRLIDSERENNTVIADEFAALISARFDIGIERIRMPVMVAIEIADGILDLAFHRKLFSEDVVIAEARKVVRGYLSGQLD